MSSHNTRSTGSDWEIGWARKAKKEEVKDGETIDFPMFIDQNLKYRVFAYVYFAEVKHGSSERIGVCAVFSHTLKNVIQEFEVSVVEGQLEEFLSKISGDMQAQRFVVPMELIIEQRQLSPITRFLKCHPEWSEYVVEIPERFTEIIQKEISSFINIAHPGILCKYCSEQASEQFLLSAENRFKNYRREKHEEHHDNTIEDYSNYRPFFVTASLCAAAAAVAICQLVDRMVFTHDILIQMYDPEWESYFNPVQIARRLLHDSAFIQFETYKVFRHLEKPGFRINIDESAFSLIHLEGKSRQELLIAIIDELFEFVDAFNFLQQFKLLENNRAASIYLLHKRPEEFADVLNRVFHSDGLPPFPNENIGLNYRLTQCIQLATYMHSVAEYILSHCNLEEILAEQKMNEKPEIQIESEEYDECPISLLENMRIAMRAGFAPLNGQESGDAQDSTNILGIDENEALTELNKQLFYENCYANFREPYEIQYPMLTCASDFIDTSEVQFYDMRVEFGAPSAELDNINL